MNGTKIEWTDRVWNPVRGCTKISPGCKFCYAETFAERWRGVPGHPYEQGFDLRLVPEKLGEPLRWKKPSRIFVNSMSDLFQDGVPDDFIDKVFAVMALAPEQTFQILTKRPERMLEYIGEGGYNGHRRVQAWNAKVRMTGKPVAPMPWPLPNVWMGVSVEGRTYLDRLDYLREVTAAVRFVSFEPLLEEIPYANLHGIQWAIVGGESGRRARPFDVLWARSILAQGRAAGVPVFVKQIGARPMLDGVPMLGYLGDPKGGTMDFWPEDLRVREFPSVEVRR